MDAHSFFSNPYPSDFINADSDPDADPVRALGYCGVTFKRRKNYGTGTLSRVCCD